MSAMDKGVEQLVPQVDESAVRHKLEQLPVYSGSMRQLFGGDHLNALGKLLCTGPLLDIDVLVATGELTPAAAVQYMKLLPEYAETFDKAHEIIHAIAAKLKPILASRISQARKQGKRESTIQGIFDQISQLSSLFQQTYRRRSQVLYLEGSLLDLLFVYIDQTVTDENDRQFFYQRYATMNSMAFLRGAYVPCKKLFDESQYGGQFDRDIATFTEPSSTPTADAVRDLSHKADEIKTLRNYRLILPHTRSYNETRIVTYKNGVLGENSDNTDICFFQLLLKPGDPIILPTSKVDAGGQTVAEVRTRPGVLLGKVNSNGELAFMSNGAISLRDVLTEKQYTMLRYRVLHQIYDYLVAKDPDIPDLFAGPPRVIAREAIAETLGAVPTLEDNIIDDTPNSSLEAVDLLDTANVIDPTPSLALAAAPIKRKVPRIGHSLKAEVVLRALKKILGEPLRKSSSHIIFKALGSNATYPISLHGGRDVTPPLLAKCLEMWGVSIPQFLAAL